MYYGNYNQQERLLKYLEIHGKITPMVAWNTLGIYRLSDVVLKLRKKGYPIITERVKVKNRFGEKCRVAEYHYHGEE